MSASSKPWTRLGSGTLPVQDPDEGLGHVVPVKTYNLVFGALVALTAITVFAATQDFGSFNLAVAMAIATVKATLVGLFFMHLNYENKLVWAVALYPLFVFFLIMLGIVGDAAVMEDVGPAHTTRAAQPEPPH